VELPSREDTRRTCVRISRTSLNVMLVFASLLWRSMTTFDSCSSSWRWSGALLPELACWRTCACREAICLFTPAMSCLMMYVSSYMRVR
jgi:hypothetical protein